MRRLFAPVIAAYMGLMKTITRTMAFLAKEIKETIRRPGALFSLVLGPFLIMALFGLGYTGVRRPLDTVVVIPPEANLPREMGFYQELGGTAVNIVDVSSDIEGTRQRLAQQRIDLMVVAPPDLEGEFRGGRQSNIRVEYNAVDPVSDNYVRLIAQQQVQEMNH